MADKLFSIEKDKVNLEDLTIIWLDKHSQDLNTKTRLRCIINFLKIFTDLHPCLEYIQSIPNEWIFIIVSGELSFEFIPLIQNLPQVLHIYIFCQYPERYSSLKSSGIFNNQEFLYSQLSKDVNYFYATHSTSTSFLPEKSLRDLTKDTGAFFWFRLFITALINMPSSDKAKQDLLHFARVYYTDNDLELQRINNFDKTYKPSEASEWYTSDSFVYRLLNKAIRTENIDLLFACRFFITDLHHQLESLHKPYIERICSYDLSELLVYRGQQMTSDDFNKLKANIGELISINSFLSTSLDRQVALMYAGDKTIHPTMESVLFKIKININENSKTHQHPFASISEFSRFEDEQEVLFSLSSMFRIESIDEQL
ncbi:unnamed protein product [Adineta steineri]|uniref:NAD(P)(+)--arginine ADP-ribosyltransferase n=2 Tax=Adineta steineri TaxID=433720 RepID=A0A813U191_9BILA|nr:unnamed protein product [Adineta steineri]